MNRVQARRNPRTSENAAASARTMTTRTTTTREGRAPARDWSSKAPAPPSTGMRAGNRTPLLPTTGPP